MLQGVRTPAGTLAAPGISRERLYNPERARRRPGGLWAAHAFVTPARPS